MLLRCPFSLKEAPPKLLFWGAMGPHAMLPVMANLSVSNCIMHQCTLQCYTVVDIFVIKLHQPPDTQQYSTKHSRLSALLNCKTIPQKGREGGGR